MVECPHCGNEVRAEEYSEHLKECRLRDKIKRGEITAVVVRKHLEIQPAEIPMLFKGTLDELKAAIAKEKDVIDDYAELENKLRKQGFTSEATIVNEIREDEIDHLAKFEAMLSRLERASRGRKEA